MSERFRKKTGFRNLSSCLDRRCTSTRNRQKPVGHLRIPCAIFMGMKKNALFVFSFFVLLFFFFAILSLPFPCYRPLGLNRPTLVFSTDFVIGLSCSVSIRTFALSSRAFFKRFLSFRIKSCQRIIFRSQSLSGRGF